MNTYERRTSDEQFETFLREESIERARCDLAPTTPIEIRHLGRTRNAA